MIFFDFLISLSHRFTDPPIVTILCPNDVFPHKGAPFGGLVDRPMAHYLEGQISPKPISFRDVNFRHILGKLAKYKKLVGPILSKLLH